MDVAEDLAVTVDELAESEFRVTVSAPGPSGYDHHLVIKGDGGWLNLITDSSEGYAMIEIEAIPKIIECLHAIERQSGKRPL